MANTDSKPPDAPPPPAAGPLPPEDTAKVAAKAEPRLEEVSLEEIDRILQEDDPEFAASLSEIKSVGVEGDFEIESAVEMDDALPEESGEEKSRRVGGGPAEKILYGIRRARSWLFTRWLLFRTKAIVLFKATVVFLRTVPKEYAQYSKVMLKAGVSILRGVVNAFLDLSLGMKITWASFLTITLAAIIFFAFNLRGIWLPELFPDAIHDMADLADRSWTEKPDEPRLSLYRAFPQEEIEFLFPKIIVNLKAINSYQSPKGIFEFYVVLDSKDSALEVQARQVEIHDKLQRAMEDQTYNELASPIGKRRVKEILKKEINELLTQGWARDVLLKTMVLKP